MYPAQWPAIFDADTHERLVRLLGDQSRRKHVTGKKRHLLSGVARCGKCGRPLYLDRTRWPWIAAREGRASCSPVHGSGECHDCRMDSQAAAAMPVPSKAGSGWRTSRGFCVSLAAVWSLLGASLCAVIFAVSLIPEQGPYYVRSVPHGLNVAGGVLEACMLPLCTLIPVPLLIAGRRYLRRSPAGTRRVTAWTAAASAGVAVEAVFWLRVYLFVSGPRWVYPRSWHALELCVGFLIAGAAMAGVLLGIPSPASQLAHPGT